MYCSFIFRVLAFMSDQMNTKRILLVEDDLVLAELVQTFFEALQLHVTHAVDGEEALKLLDEETFDYVVTDLRMPRVDGLDFVRMLYEHGGKIPIYVTTGNTNTDIHDQLINLGVKQVYQKPLTPAQYQELGNLLKSS